MNFDKFKEWVLLSLLTGAVYILWQMKENVSSLNTKIEIVIDHQIYDRKEITDHESRIRGLERK